MTSRISTGDQVSYREFGDAGIYTVIEVCDGGQRIRLDDGFGDIGYPVLAHLVTPIRPSVPTTRVVEHTETPSARLIPVLEHRSIRQRTARRMSLSAVNTILDLGCGGRIERGRGAGKLDIRQIRALHDRGYLVAYVSSDDPHRIVSATVTGAGVERALELAA